MRITSFIAAALVAVLALPAAAQDYRLPRVIAPAGFTGGANIDRLESVMAAVISGNMDLLDAQVPPAVVTVEPGQAIKVAWEYTFNAFRPVKFRLWLDGATILKNLVPTDLTVTGAAVGGTVQTFTTNDGVVPAFTSAQVGTHTLTLTSYDASTNGGTSLTESDKGPATITFNVGFTTAPPPPAGFRTIVIKLALGPNGEVRFLGTSEVK